MTTHWVVHWEFIFFVNVICLLVRFINGAVVQVSNPFDPYRLECPHKYSIVKLTLQRVESVGGVRNDTMIASFCENIAKLYPSERDETAPADDESCRWTVPMEIPGENFGFSEVCSSREFIAGISRQEMLQYGFLCCKLKDRKRKKCFANRYTLPSNDNPEIAVEREQLLLSSFAYQDNHLIAQFCDYAVMTQDEIDAEVIRESKAKLSAWFASQKTTTKRSPIVVQGAQPVLRTTESQPSNSGQNNLVDGETGDFGSDNFLPQLIPRDKNEFGVTGETRPPTTRYTVPVIGLKLIKVKAPIRYSLSPEELAAFQTPGGSVQPSDEENNGFPDGIFTTTPQTLPLVRQRVGVAEFLANASARNFPASATIFQTTATASTSISTQESEDNNEQEGDDATTVQLPVDQQRASLANFLNGGATLPPASTTQSILVTTANSETSVISTLSPEEVDQEGFDATTGPLPVVQQRVSLSNFLNGITTVPPPTTTKKPTLKTTTNGKTTPEEITNEIATPEGETVTVPNALDQQRLLMNAFIQSAVKTTLKTSRPPTTTTRTTTTTAVPVDDNDNVDNEFTTTVDPLEQQRVSLAAVLRPVVVERKTAVIHVSTAPSTTPSTTVEAVDDSDNNSDNEVTTGNPVAQQRGSVAAFVKPKVTSHRTVTPMLKTTTPITTVEPVDDNDSIEVNVTPDNIVAQQRGSVAAFVKPKVTSHRTVTPKSKTTRPISTAEPVYDNDSIEVDVTPDNLVIQQRVSLATPHVTIAPFVSTVLQTTEISEDNGDNGEADETNSENAVAKQRVSLAAFLQPRVTPKKSRATFAATVILTTATPETTDENENNENEPTTPANPVVQQRVSLAAFLHPKVTKSRKVPTLPSTIVPTTQPVENVDEGDNSDNEYDTTPSPVVRQRGSVASALRPAGQPKPRPKAIPTTPIPIPSTTIASGTDDSETDENDFQTPADSVVQQRASLAAFLRPVVTERKGSFAIFRTTVASTTPPTIVPDTGDEGQNEDEFQTTSNPLVRQRGSLDKLLHKIVTPRPFPVTKAPKVTTKSPQNEPENGESEYDNGEVQQQENGGSVAQQRSAAGKLLNKIATTETPSHSKKSNGAISRTTPRSHKRKTTLNPGQSTDKVVLLEVVTPQPDGESENEPGLTKNKQQMTTLNSKQKFHAKQPVQQKSNEVSETITSESDVNSLVTEVLSTQTLIKVKHGKQPDRTVTSTPKRPRTTSTPKEKTTTTTENSSDVLELTKEEYERLEKARALLTTEIPTKRTSKPKTKSFQPQFVATETIPVGQSKFVPSGIVTAPVIPLATRATLLPEPPAVIVVPPDNDMSSESIPLQNNLIVKSVSQARIRINTNNRGPTRSPEEEGEDAETPSGDVHDTTFQLEVEPDVLTPGSEEPSSLRVRSGSNVTVAGTPSRVNSFVTPSLPIVATQTSTVQIGSNKLSTVNKTTTTTTLKPSQTTKVIFIDVSPGIHKGRFKNQNSSKIQNSKAKPDDYYYYYEYDGPSGNNVLSSLAKVISIFHGARITTRAPEVHEENVFCNTTLAATEETSGLVIACGKDANVWVPPRCPVHTFCMASLDTNYRLCCPAPFNQL